MAKPRPSVRRKKLSQESVKESAPPEKIHPIFDDEAYDDVEFSAPLPPRPIDKPRDLESDAPPPPIQKPPGLNDDVEKFYDDVELDAVPYAGPEDYEYMQDQTAPPNARPPPPCPKPKQLDPPVLSASAPAGGGPMYDDYEAMDPGEMDGEEDDLEADRDLLEEAQWFHEGIPRWVEG